MQLFRQLVDVYDTLSRADSCDRLIPLYHSLNKANVTVTIDAAGNFVNAVVLAKEDDRVTLIPGTCASLCRSSDATPRALADKLSYLAGDYDDFLPDAFKGIYQKRHADYMNQLKDWSESECGIPQVSAVYQYLAKNTLLHDLATCGLLGNSDCSYEAAKQGYADFCAEKGIIKKTLLEAYSRPRQNGVNAITLREDDGLIQVCMTNGNNEVLIANRNGRAIRFHESAVREMGRTAAGVRGMTLDDDGSDEVVGMACIKDKDKDAETILVVSEQGYGKRSDVDDYRKTNRGGKGVKTINITEKTGKLVAMMNVTNDNDLMIINKSGIAIRMKVADLSIIGRATQGVRLINLEKRNDEIASVCKVLSEKEEMAVGDKAEQKDGDAEQDYENNTNE